MVKGKCGLIYTKEKLCTHAGRSASKKGTLKTDCEVGWKTARKQNCACMTVKINKLAAKKSTFLQSLF